MIDHQPKEYNEKHITLLKIDKTIVEAFVGYTVKLGKFQKTKVGILKWGYGER